MDIREEVAAAGLLASDEGRGKQLVAADAYKAARRLRLTISYMSTADRRSLARFYLDTTVGPCRVWEWTHPKSGQTHLLRFDPESPPVYRRAARHPDRHHAEIPVVEDLADGYVTGVYGS